MYPDHEFDPITPEEEAQRAQEAEFARRVRREVLRIERGEAEEEIRADLEREAAEKAEAEERERRERRRRASTFWQLFSGTILVREGISKYYPYMLSIAGMFFLSIAVMFTALHLDMKYTRLEREVQILRERSIRLQEQRYSRTTHSAIVERLRERGIDLATLRPGRDHRKLNGDEAGAFEDQKRHSAAGTAALRAVHTRGAHRVRTPGLGTAFQRRSGLQRRPARQPHLHRRDHPGPAGQHPRAQRGTLATSIFRYQAAFDFASPGLDSLKTFREQGDSLAKLLAAFFLRTKTCPRPMPNASARSTPAATGWSTAATPPTCAPKGGCRA